MIEEEKQPDNTSQQTDETNAVSQESSGTEEAVTDVTPSVEVDLESSPSFDEQMAEASTVEAATEQGKDGESVGTESVTNVSLSEGELANLEALKRENEELRTKLDEINQQCDGFKTQSIRIAADFDNFRKRTAKEKEDLEQQVKRVTISELLPVVDNFERARSQIKPQNDGEMAIHKSYQGVYKQLVDSLKRIGVSPMRPEGQEFDPNLHEAVMREPTDEYPEGTVIEQLMRGYLLNDRVLRHAMVKVAAAPENKIEDAGEDSQAVAE
ncbi:MAG TPA: nucleotide exchange factor GrpE [Cyanobacteria bacterium UBA8553]|nr:nucleotide exchange factor GrpE [Cyanobacteria bacterium UBA8553]HAJ59868.1 nucleotide exchange factor GrpE [Cyanobacteria bacterium UBA8543]